MLQDLTGKRAVDLKKKEDRIYSDKPHAIYMRDYYKNNKSYAVYIKEYSKKYKKKYSKNNPWYTHYRHARSRCLYEYGKYKKKGIKFLMTINEFKYLWFRDKAYLMEKPSIDRIDSTGNYELKNCRYLEFLENSMQGLVNRKHIKPYKGDV